MKSFGPIWKIAVSLVVAAAMFTLVINVVRMPVAAQTHSYTAEFTDVSGLHEDADVRVRGVRVGTVSAIELKRENDESVAAVGFTLDKRYGIVAGSRLSIKYQALTGVRYVDVEDPAEPYVSKDLVRNIPTSMTQPSFDVTVLFNGLQPVLATLKPEEINTFTANAVTYLSGDGSGLGPMLDSIHKLTDFVSNRQDVISTVMHNLADVAATLGGKSKSLIQILEWLNLPVDSALSVLDEFRKSSLFGPEFTAPVVRLLNNVGFKWGNNFDGGLDKAFTNIDNAVEAFKLVPVMWDNLPPPSQSGQPRPCSKGRAQLPGDMDVLLNGQRVVICNR